jgi:hypothetical protein
VAFGDPLHRLRRHVRPGARQRLIAGALLVGIDLDEPYRIRVVTLQVSPSFGGVVRGRAFVLFCAHVVVDPRPSPRHTRQRVRPR